MSDLKLRKFTLRDAGEVTHLVGDESVSKWTTQIPFPYREQDAIDWINRTATTGDRHPFAVEVDHKIVGCVSYWYCGENTIEVGYWVGKAYWGGGLCTQALSMLMSRDFFPRNCDVIARVMEGNVGSERVLQKCGFVYSGKCVVEKAGRQIKSKLFIRRNETGSRGSFENES